MSGLDIEDVELEEDTTQQTPQINTDWYLFTKEQVVGLLSLGSGHNLELSNPVVMKHLIFIPEYDPNKPINQLSQSKKWREGFSRNQRLQMITSRAGHFFLYKPICQTSGEWIAPLFFFQQSGTASIISQGKNPSNIKILVNADKDFHSPFLTTVDMDTITATFVESNDRKVMYYGYCKIPLPNPWRTKANGLPPGMTNQEYNIHFLSTSNKASALELGKKIVDGLNILGKDGFTTYDKCQKEEVLVMVVPLCHLGDSPMHAPREWATTKSQTYKLWELLQNPKKHTEFRRKSKEYGVKDTTNDQFMFQDLDNQFGDCLFNPFLHLEGFDGHLDTPVESLHVVLLGVVKYLFRDVMENLPDLALPSVLARWKSFATSGLNVPPIQPKTLTSYYQSLVERQRMWTALVHLGSYIFQTDITHMRRYLENLKKLVNIFLGHLIQWTAQWTNKAKFHMLVHLVQSIDCFGPLSLVATQKFESFNGLHIATVFLCAHLLRLLFSGGSVWHCKYHFRARGGKKLIELFSQNKWVQKRFAYKNDWNAEGTVSMKGTTTASVSTPIELKKGFPKHIWSPMKEAILASQQRVHLQNFVLMDLNFWEGKGSRNSEYLAKIKVCEVSHDIDEFYGFRGLSISQEDLWISIKNIKCVLTTQHNCNLAQCQPRKSQKTNTGQLPVNSPYQIEHQPFNAYLINLIYSRKKEKLKQEQVARNNKKKDKLNWSKRKCEDIDPALY
ncbi:hypothetical protein DFH28DRAFT_949193 [Melampsora americana]|nr:hypothetical protein DFH28DRAFT_949193 [Melampsora americana]